jgi:DNA-binding transcriptional MerR regulator
MHSSFMPPRQVEIGDAAAFVGTTPPMIRHYQEIGLLPETDRGSDDRRGYGYEDVIRMLWIRKMADAGITLEDICDTFADTGSAVATTADNAAGMPDRMALLSDVVTNRLESLPEGSLRQADLDSLLVMERIFGPLGAAVNATRFIALATHPGLREKSDRVDAAEKALDDTIAVDDPRVAQVAAERHAFELMLDTAIEDAGLGQGDDALFDPWEALHPATADEGAKEDGQGSCMGQESMSAFEAVRWMPYDFSPARLRCMELAEEMAARDLHAS